MKPLKHFPISARFQTLLLMALPLVGCSTDRPPEPTWWKGNLHTHSYWSDGDDYPEMVVSWYKDHGYNFTALTEHNVIADGEMWIEVETNSQRMDAYTKYLEKFGEDWVEDDDQGSVLQVRLRTLDEFRGLFEVPHEFLMIRSEEITDEFDGAPVHLNAINLLEVIPPLGGETKRDVLQNTVDAVHEQRNRTGQPMLVQVNHPNYGWALTPGDLAALEGERFFELYNGHPSVNNQGDNSRVSTERMWDIVLAERLSQGGEVMYGVAVDDAHSYHGFTSRHANPGRGWVMVRSEELTADAIVTVMDEGKFYSSTGVSLADVCFEDGTLSLEIVAEEGVSYTTQFIGTSWGYDATKLLIDDEVLSSARYRYSDEVGAILAEESGLAPGFAVSGDELYVRAKVISTREKANPNYVGEVEVAWTQPIVVRHTP